MFTWTYPFIIMQRFFITGHFLCCKSTPPDVTAAIMFLNNNACVIHLPSSFSAFGLYYISVGFCRKHAWAVTFIIIYYMYYNVSVDIDYLHLT